MAQWAQWRVPTGIRHGISWSRGALEYLVQNSVLYVGEVIVVEFANGLQPRHGLLGASGTGRKLEWRYATFPESAGGRLPRHPCKGR